jgi:hypothetical protein
MFGTRFSQWRLGGGKGKIAILGGGAPVSSPFLLKSRTFTNAEILTLNATPITIVPAISGALFVPFMWNTRQTKPGAAAWTTSPLLALIHEGDTTNLMTSTIAPTLNTAAAVDSILEDDGVNTAILNLITFNRIGKALQLRSTNVPNQGAGSPATIIVTVALYLARY